LPFLGLTGDAAETDGSIHLSIQISQASTLAKELAKLGSKTITVIFTATK